MRISIQDEGALNAVSPSALSAYARAAGWTKEEPYGEHSDVYVRGDALGIVIPRTQHLGDYADVVSRLIEIFAEAAETDALSLYRDLVTADCDIVRVRAAPEGADGTVPVEDGVRLINGVRKMVLAAACSWSKPRQLYYARANQQAANFMRKVRLGQTERGSYVVTLLAPVVSLPILQAAAHDSEMDAPHAERSVTKLLIEALTATQKSIERTSRGDADAFMKAVERGASANLCRAVATLIKPFGGIDISLTWALTYPMRVARNTVCFGASDAPILSEAAQRLQKQHTRHISDRNPGRFQDRKPKPDMPVQGRIQHLRRDRLETNGTVTLQTHDDRYAVLITATLDPRSYELAIQAHKDDATVVMTGDLEQCDGQWHMQRAHIENVISDEGGDFWTRNQ